MGPQVQIAEVIPPSKVGTYPETFWGVTTVILLVVLIVLLLSWAFEKLEDADGDDSPY